MYYVVEIFSVGPSLGQMLKCSDWRNAVNKVVELALEQANVPEKEIREEVEESGSFTDQDGEFAICIG